MVLGVGGVRLSDRLGGREGGFAGNGWWTLCTLTIQVLLQAMGSLRCAVLASLLVRSRNQCGTQRVETQADTCSLLSLKGFLDVGFGFSIGTMCTGSAPVKLSATPFGFELARRKAMCSSTDSVLCGRTPAIQGSREAVLLKIALLSSLCIWKRLPSSLSPHLMSSRSDGKTRSCRLRMNC